MPAFDLDVCPCQAMTGSAFAWLDYSDSERRRMLEVIDLFREKGTLDELGIGSIRDTFADRFFPAISTIQTRARYFLFVPWLYQALERERIPSARASAHARRQQAKLVASLKAGGEEAAAGVIGIDAGANIQRPPSVIYWAGIRRLGLLSQPGTMDRYHASLDLFYHGARRALRSEGEELLERAQHNWNPSLPVAPEDLLTATSFALRREDAEFLAEQIRNCVGDSLLGHCLSGQIKRMHSARTIWGLGGLETLEPKLREDIEHARRFALVMEGAVLTYNLMLAEGLEAVGGRQDDALSAQYRAELVPWSDEIRAEQASLSTWDLPAMWARLRAMNPRIPPGAQQFAEHWISAAISAPHRVMDDDTVRQLIAQREWRLKGGLARLRNPRALERWNGRSEVAG
ncbi:MAG: hypothetical protein IPO51_14885 [Dehalococcoidia bacterium]|nr:hypothetical protein [Dehalococcoidia bacterium]